MIKINAFILTLVLPENTCSVPLSSSKCCFCFSFLKPPYLYEICSQTSFALSLYVSNSTRSLLTYFTREWYNNSTTSDKWQSDAWSALLATLNLWRILFQKRTIRHFYYFKWNADLWNRNKFFTDWRRKVGRCPTTFICPSSMCSKREKCNLVISFRAII